MMENKKHAGSEIARKIRKEMEEYDKTPEGQEKLKQKHELEQLELDWTEKVKQEHDYDRRSQDMFLTILPEAMFGMKPDLEWRLPQQMFNDAMFEAWNIDETTAHSHMAMKFALFRIIVPCDRWNEKITHAEFQEYAKKFFEYYYFNH